MYKCENIDGLFIFLFYSDCMYQAVNSVLSIGNALFTIIFRCFNKSCNGICTSIHLDESHSFNFGQYIHCNKTGK